MKLRYRSLISRTVMFALVFLGMALVFSGSFGNGRKREVTVGITGWLEVRQTMSDSTVEHVSFARLGLELCIAVGITVCMAAVSADVRREQSSAMSRARV